MNSVRRRLLFVINDANYFVSHRLAVAVAAMREGFEIHVATPGASNPDIVGAGIIQHDIRMSRSGTRPLEELRTIVDLWRLVGRLRPSLIHAVTIKPVIYAGLVARARRVPAFVAAISGLGTVFIATGLRASLGRAIVRLLYSTALRQRRLKVIFQNEADRHTFLGARLVAKQDTVLLRGSGVPLEVYRVRPEPPGPPVFAMASRLLRDKGVCEFVRAAQLLRERGIDAKFRLIGEIDPGNRTSITQDEIARWKREGIVELLGFRRDIADQFGDVHAVVLPSYREGLPRVLIEAAACGRATITTDVPGCRDAIEPDVTGLLVPPRDVDALADAMQRLAENGEARSRMGAEGRKLAAREFGIEKVVDAHLELYRELASPP